MNMPEADQEFEALLSYLKRSRGYDLTGYKRPTLMRRFRHRMQEVKIDNYQDYLHYLQDHSQEQTALIDTVLINVTQFFRDRDAWDYLQREIIPEIIAHKQPNEPIRVWSAGCASGQEIYSLVISFAEALGIKSCLQRAQFYATDIDKAAIQQARQATYSSTEVAGIPPDLLKKYFEQTQLGYVFHPKLCRTILFGHHDLAMDAPISKVDLLVCRNALMYFNSETQAGILVRLHFGLKNDGFLFLGSAETIVTRRHIFTPVDLKHRVFKKGLSLGLDDHLLLHPKSRKKQEVIEPIVTRTQVRQIAYQTSPFAQLAVDSNGCLVTANEQANTLFGLTLNNLGRPLQSLKPGQLVSSHTSIEQLCNVYQVSPQEKHRPVILKCIQWVTPSGTTYLDISITPIFNSHGQLLGVNLTFTDVTCNQQLEDKLEQANSELARVSHRLKETEAELDIQHFDWNASKGA